MSRVPTIMFYSFCAIWVGIAAVHLRQLWAFPLIGGVLLVLWSLFAPNKRPQIIEPGELQMLIPDKWNEHDISLGLERYQGNPNVLGKYVDGILSRFVAGQDKRTIEVRTAFLERFNEYAAVARESYKWQRYMKGGRAKMEEDAEDARAEAAFKQAQADLQLVDLDTELKRQEKLLKIEKLKREMADLNRPAAPVVPRTSSAEIREQKRRDLKQREDRVVEEMRITSANPTLSEDQKQRKLNALEDMLGQIHEEQASLL